jgi:hypothetical protein
MERKSKLSVHRALLATAVLLGALVPAQASAVSEEESEIIVGCHFSMGEWGQEGIQMCIRENMAVRAEVRAYPEEHQQIVERCARRRELGWSVVKKCVDDEIAAGPALVAHARAHREKVDWCRERFFGHSDTRILICVEQSIAAEKERAAK